MNQTFSLYWLRENGMDAGTVLTPDQLEPAIRQRVLEAAAGAAGELSLKLPFLDRREVRRRNEVLGALQFHREESAILPVMSHRFALRTLAADLALANPVWTNAPRERQPDYVHTWQAVSTVLQKAMRTWIPRIYFQDVRRYEDRAAAYPLVIYEAARIFRGRGTGEFTFEIRDFPYCTAALEIALRMIGASTQRVLSGIEQRLDQEGMTSLARRYAPLWHEDILREVRRRPRPFVDLLAAETHLISAIIDLGTARTPEMAGRFSQVVNLRLRNVYGMDLRRLAFDALHETTRVLSGSEN